MSTMKNRIVLSLMIAAAGACAPVSPSIQQPGMSLVGTVSFQAPSGQLEQMMVTVGDGGTGRYPAVLAGDPSLATHTIYRPADLSPFGPNNRLPIVAWGNGACRNNSGEYRNYLAELASHGYLVVAIGPAAPSLVMGSGQAGGGGTESSQLFDGVEWAIAQDGQQGSEYFQKVDHENIAVMGHSCGGIQALDVSGDPRVKTSIILNSGVLPGGGPGGPGGPGAGGPPGGGGPPSPPAGGPGGGSPASGMAAMNKGRLAELHSPVAYLVGGPEDIAYGNAVDDFEQINHVPVFFGSQDVGHYPATFLDNHGGDFGVAAVAWLNWHLKGDEAAARQFVGDDCGLCGDASWTVQTKNLQ